MRISDWSSDVCSSDLKGLCILHHSRRGIAVTGSEIVKSCFSPDISSFRRKTWRSILERRILSYICADVASRSEEHTSELQSLMRISYAVFCLKKKKKILNKHQFNKNKALPQHSRPLTHKQ